NLYDIRGTSFIGKRDGFGQIDSTTLDKPGRVDPMPDPYAMEEERAAAPCSTGESAPAPELVQLKPRKVDREHQVIRMPSFEQVSAAPVLYAHASRLLHLEANPGNARALVQRPGNADVWITPPPLPCRHRRWTRCTSCRSRGCRTRSISRPSCRRTR